MKHWHAINYSQQGAECLSNFTILESNLFMTAKSGVLFGLSRLRFICIRQNARQVASKNKVVIVSK